MAFSQLLTSMAMLLTMVLPGIIFKKKGLITESQTKCISNIIINLIVPAIIINAFQIEYSKKMVADVFKIMGLTGIMIAACGVILVILSKAAKFSNFEKGIFATVLMIPNTGFIGIPLMNAFYGSEGLLYVSIMEIAGDIFMSTVVYSIFSKNAGHKEKMQLREFFSPLIIAVIIGFVLFIFNITLPPFLSGAVKNISDASGALAMFVLGSQLADIKIKEFLGNVKVYIQVGARLIIMPIVAFVIMRLILKDTSLLSTVFVLTWGLPAGVFGVVLAEKFNTDPAFATKCVMLSNILCLITIPICAMVL
ncbi:MAG: AEC family transporter [Lachnospiraceae bacterium]|nr:AEC family transporter [Lachnospiraceae bacterium]